MRVLSLGAAGFIGSHLTHRLLNEGHTVIGVDIENDKISEFLNHESLMFLGEDIRNQDCNLDELVKDSDSFSFELFFDELSLERANHHRLAGLKLDCTRVYLMKFLHHLSSRIG